MTKQQIRKMLGALAQKVKDNEPIYREERSYLSKALGCISQGDDPAEVFGLVYGVGKKEADDHSRASLSFLFWWITCATESHVEGSISLSEAFREASRISQLRGNNLKPIQASSLKRKWYSGKLEHLKRLLLHPKDKDMPLGFWI